MPWGHNFHRAFPSKSVLVLQLPKVLFSLKTFKLYFWGYRAVANRKMLRMDPSTSGLHWAQTSASLPLTDRGRPTRVFIRDLSHEAKRKRWWTVNVGQKQFDEVIGRKMEYLPVIVDSEPQPGSVPNIWFNQKKTPFGPAFL